MSDIWAFLTSSENRETLSWLGGGLVVFAGGLWTLLKYFIGRKSAGESTSSASKPAASRVSAGQGGFAAGRDLRIDSRSGMPPGHLVLLVVALIGAILIAVSQAGNQVSVSNGIGIGGNVEGSVITNQ